LDNNFSLQIQRFNTESAAAAIAIADADFDPTFTATASKSVRQSAQPSSVLDGVTTQGPRSDNVAVRLGASQLIATGATVQAGTNLLRHEPNSRTALLNPAYNGDVSLTVRQPLLRGFGPAYNRANIARARFGLEAAEHDFRGTVLDVVRAVEVAYFNLAFA